MTLLNELTANEALAQLKGKQISARALTDAYLARTDARDADVGAWIYMNPDHARAQADALDASLAAGTPPGPLHGLPVGLKDILDTADMPTENGSKLFAGRRPATDSTIAKLLRDAGAVIMGKTVTTEFALSAPGKTKNPHDLTRTPGGSSQGSAAGVADYQMALSVGSQTGGSMIRPASFCGIYGYKPTFGTISRAGMCPLARPLDHPGVYGRTLADLALIADVLMVSDPADLDMRANPGAGLSKTLARPLSKAPRIAFVKGPMWVAAEPCMDDLFKSVLDTLGPDAHEVEMTGVFDGALDCQTMVMMPNVIANIGDYVENSPKLVHPETIRRTKDCFNILASDYVKAIEMKDSITAAVHRMFQHADVIITASAPGEAPVGLESTGNAIFQKIWTLVGAPSITLPKLTGPNGMPIGVQVIGRPGYDADTFRNAAYIDSIL